MPAIDPTSVPFDYYLRGLDFVAEDGSSPSITVTPLPTTTVSDFPTMSPGFTPEVHWSLTVVFVILYTALFILAYIQLWMIYYYRHKRLSYQSVFLFLCLIWSGLRVTLFSFYFQNVKLANDLPIFAYWLLYCFPVCIQFSLLCLLVLYFAQVLIKARVRYGGPRRYRLYLRLGMFAAVAIFLSTDVSCAILNKLHQDMTLFDIILTRVIICDTLFILASVALSFCVYKLATMSSANILLEAKGATVTQASLVCVVTILLYISHAVYDLIAISLHQVIPDFGLGWINVSDEGYLFNIHKGYGYLSFGLVLFFWEVLPTFTVIIFFRVRRPNIIVTTSTMNSGHSVGSYFFNQPRRFSSDEDLTRSTSSVPARSLPVEDPRLTRSFNANLSSPRRPFAYRRLSDRITITQSVTEQEERSGSPPVQTLETAGTVNTATSPDE
ncbi:G protein-coupled receptor 137Ba-like [Paramacrobiotus metropolitanus]|uniref:G protein-coupled receptor 137Ba-like n=1 Tax=Paramacrobiotus metropolitanus TaxID=2943436 RepID=UPI002445E182|nr:G protein-coupled receptor 137Ba-like [Paramacrobiotus metropolitanus]